MRPRFSIRTLLILTAIVAAACYWWVARPTILANRFVRAVQAEDFAAANRLFAVPSDVILARQRAGVEVPLPYPPGMGSTMVVRDEPYDVQWKITQQPRTWRDILQSRRRITLSGSYLIATTRTTNVEFYEIDATPRGLAVVRRIVHGYGR